MMKKQSKSIVSPAMGTTTETMIIVVEWIRRADTGLSVGAAEESVAAAGVAEESAAAKVVAASPMNVGKNWDGGNVAVHPSYPTCSLKEEYASSRNVLYCACSALVYCASPYEYVVRGSDGYWASSGTATRYPSINGTGELVRVIQLPPTKDVVVTE